MFWIRCFFLFFVLYFGLKTPLHSEENNYNIQFSFQDGRKWKKVPSVDDQYVKLTEYFLEGETKDNWSELVTTQYFVARVDFSLDTFFDNFIKELAKNNPKNKIDSRIICSTEDSFFAEWWIRDKSPADQNEWVHIFKQNKAVGILRYTTKRINKMQAKAKIWEKTLGQALFKPL